MENQEIIELGSSDDEAGPPAPKKVKPNAMVHFPNKIRAMSIEPSNTSHTVKNVSGNSVIRLPNIATASSCAASTLKNKTNGRCTVNSTSKPTCIKLINNRTVPVKNKLNINPINLLTHSSALLNRKVPEIKVMKPKVNIQQQVLTKLPPSITITRTQGARQSVQSTSALGLNKFRVNKKLAINPSSVKKNNRRLGDILTVELDDDNSQSSSAIGSPQWYLRPEEQLASNSLEEKNNKEPEPRKMIEITIDDSPVKPCLPKESNKNKELFIMIEDSPTKLLNEATTKGSEKDKIKNPHSKKQLNYPKTSDSVIEQCESTEATAVENNADSNKLNEEEKNGCKSLDVEDDCGNQKDTESNQQDHKTNNDNETQICDVNAIEKLTQNKSQDDGNTKPIHKDSDSNYLGIGEFHPIVQKFINLCCEIDKTDDMKKIIEKRIKNYYRQVSKAYVESEEFLDLVSTKIIMTEADPTKMYLYLKDVVDELNLQRKIAKTSHIANQQKSVEEDADNYNINYDSKQQRQIHKLEKTIKKLNRAIKKLEEQEVDFDDEEDSVYLLTERYKERLIRVYEKFCKMSNTKMPSEPHILIQSRPGQPPGPARKLEKLINKKVPIGTPLMFPDFHDVLKCVREANEEDKLGWNEAEIMDEARDLFTSSGKKLQRRRQENEWRLAASWLTQNVDPAEKDKLLKTKLDDNKIVAERKETEIFNRYADKQKQLHLEATEISDIEADESPEESEDEELNDNSNSLDDKQKRKDRLRRLLKEKSMRKKGLSCKDIKKNTVDSISNYNKDDSKKSENEKKGDVVECIQQDLKHNEHELSKSFDLKGTIHGEQNEGNKNYEENYGCKEDSNNTTDNYIIEKETEINDGFTASKDPVKSNSEVSDNVYLICDDSDADELNLLQKLHSGNEISESSEYDESTVDVSDTSESNSETQYIDENDVISIENSSYSESEPTEHDFSADTNTIKKNAETPCNFTDKVQDIDVADTSIDEKMKSNYDENLLLASSEDEDNASKDNDRLDDEFINLKDDEISIDETVITVDAHDKIIDVNKSDHGYVNLKDDEITISETFIGRINRVESMNKATDEDSKKNEEKEIDNRKGNDCSDDKLSEKKSNNDDINNKVSIEKEPCTGEGYCDHISKEIIYRMLTDTIENVENDKSKLKKSDSEISEVNYNTLNEVNVCDTNLYFEKNIQTLNQVMDCIIPTPIEKNRDNMDNNEHPNKQAVGDTDVYNNSNMIKTNQCIPFIESSVISPQTKSIEMMLEEMLSPING